VHLVGNLKKVYTDFISFLVQNSETGSQFCCCWIPNNVSFNVHQLPVQMEISKTELQEGKWI